MPCYAGHFWHVPGCLHCLQLRPNAVPNHQQPAWNLIPNLYPMAMPGQYPMMNNYAFHQQQGYPYPYSQHHHHHQQQPPTSQRWRDIPRPQQQHHFVPTPAGYHAGVNHHGWVPTVAASFPHRNHQQPHHVFHGGQFPYPQGGGVPLYTSSLYTGPNHAYGIPPPLRHFAHSQPQNYYFVPQSQQQQRHYNGSFRPGRRQQQQQQQQQQPWVFPNHHHPHHNHRPVSPYRQSRFGNPFAPRQQQHHHHNHHHRRGAAAAAVPPEAPAPPPAYSFYPPPGHRNGQRTARMPPTGRVVGEMRSDED